MTKWEKISLNLLQGLSFALILRSMFFTFLFLLKDFATVHLDNLEIGDDEIELFYVTSQDIFVTFYKFIGLVAGCLFMAWLILYLAVRLYNVYSRNKSLLKSNLVSYALVVNTLLVVLIGDKDISLILPFLSFYMATFIYFLGGVILLLVIKGGENSVPNDNSIDGC